MVEILFFCMCVFVLFLFVSRLQRLSRVKFYRVNSRFISRFSYVLALSLIILIQIKEEWILSCRMSKTW